MKLAALTSGAVIALVFATLPTAARRMGDPELLRGYLALHLPDAVDDVAGVPGLDAYRAMAAHLAAHVMCGSR